MIIVVALKEKRGKTMRHILMAGPSGKGRTRDVGLRMEMDVKGEIIKIYQVSRFFLLLLRFSSSLSSTMYNLPSSSSRIISLFSRI